MPFDKTSKPYIPQLSFEKPLDACMTTGYTKPCTGKPLGACMGNICEKSKQFLKFLEHMHAL